MICENMPFQPGNQEARKAKKAKPRPNRASRAEAQGLPYVLVPRVLSRRGRLVLSNE
jgi:hypothetical protein